MGSNFHTPWTGSTLFKDTSMNPALASLDKGITYPKNAIVHSDGAITYDKTTGVLTWASALRILFNREDGQAIQNTISAGNITLADNEFAYVTLNEANNTVLTVSKASVTTGIASNFLTVGIVVLAYRNSASDELFPVYLSPYLLNIPLETVKGGTGLSVLGTMNKILGVNSGATGLEYKAITGTDEEIEVIHNTESIIIGMPNVSYATVQTLDDTVTTLMSKTLTEGKVYILIAYVVAKQADTNRASYIRRAYVYRPVAGVAILEGSVQDGLTIESNAAWDVTIDVDTNDARIRVTGYISTTIDWKGKLEFMEI